MSAAAATTRTTAMPGHLANEAIPRSIRSATALDVLECFAVDGELGVTDIALRLGVAKSTVHRVLTTLCAGGLTEHEARQLVDELARDQRARAAAAAAAERTARSR